MLRVARRRMHSGQSDALGAQWPKQTSNPRGGKPLRLKVPRQTRHVGTDGSAEGRSCAVKLAWLGSIYRCLCHEKVHASRDRVSKHT